MQRLKKQWLSPGACRAGLRSADGALFLGFIMQAKLQFSVKT